MVKIGVIGTGFVGLTHAAVTARYGHNIIGYDLDPNKVEAFNSGEKDKIEKYVSEKNLSDIVKEQLQTGRLSFTSNPELLSDRELLFLCLPTPYKNTGESDLSYFFQAADTIASVLLKRENQNFILFANKSTVPIGTAKKLNDYLSNKGLTNFDVASNPEFLPEGEAVTHAIHPSKVIVGANRPESFKLFRESYSSFVNRPGYNETKPEVAETSKYMSNGLLFSQIVAWSSIGGKICEALDIDYEDAKKCVLADPRIAGWGSYLSAGVGGSCFKKDALSLKFQLEAKGIDSSYIELVNNINEHQKYYLIERAENEAAYNFNMKRIALLGTAFKQGTNDMRESNVLEVVPRLLMRGVEEIKIYDPLALDEAKKIFNPIKNQNYNRLSYHNNVKDALINTNVTYIATDHQEFRSVGDTIISTINGVKHPYLIIDGRRMISSDKVKELLSKGVSYLPTGGTFKKSV